MAILRNQSHNPRGMMTQYSNWSLISKTVNCSWTRLWYLLIVVFKYASVCVLSHGLPSYGWFLFCTYQSDSWDVNFISKLPDKRRVRFYHSIFRAFQLHRRSFFNLYHHHTRSAPICRGNFSRITRGSLTKVPGKHMPAIYSHWIVFIVRHSTRLRGCEIWIFFPGISTNCRTSKLLVILLV